MDDTSASDHRHGGGGGGPEQQQPHGEQPEGGHSGEGAASALAHLKSQVKQHRHPTAGDGEEGAGAGGHLQ